MSLSNLKVSSQKVSSQTLADYRLHTRLSHPAILNRWSFRVSYVSPGTADQQFLHALSDRNLQTGKITMFYLLWPLTRPQQF